jgi:hypothetical protein
MNIKKTYTLRWGSVVKFMEPTTASNEQTYKLQRGRRRQIHGINHSNPMSRLTIYNKASSDPWRQSLKPDEQTYQLQRRRRRQIYGVNHSNPMSRLTPCNEEGIIRSTVSITRTRGTDLHPVTRKGSSGLRRQSLEPDEQTYNLQRGMCRQIHGINHSNPMGRLTPYNEEGVVRSTASITRTQ